MFVPDGYGRVAVGVVRHLGDVSVRDVGNLLGALNIYVRDDAFVVRRYAVNWYVLLVDDLLFDIGHVLVGVYVD